MLRSLAPQDIERLLQPYLSAPLSPRQLEQLRSYLELLLRWNARVSLTAVRNTEDIVTRHFGESLFAGEQLRLERTETLADLGSGAGFPGLPIKVLTPHLRVTLIESQHKKAAFLRETIRALELREVSVHAGRAEELTAVSQVVTMRAVEKFQDVLPTAASLVTAGGRLAMLIGAAQVEVARAALRELQWQEPVAITQSRERVLFVGERLKG
jgi:16S rRNA (guanine527-N7)-methyltransferase